VLLLTEKDLKKLNRYQLLEMLIVQTERADQLQKLLEETQKKLEDREIKIASLGSIAEAALQLTGVIEAAQNAADLYVNSARKFAKDIEADAYQEAASILANAQAQARSIRSEERTDEIIDEQTK
jgi:RNA polymerase-interacting CarD/CdnL/TRCF family regulator